VSTRVAASVAVIAEGGPARAPRRRRRFYVGLSLLLAAIVVLGFAPSFFAIARGAPKPWIVHVHAAVFLGWLALLVWQAVLAARGKIAAHKRVGTFGIAYACIVLVLGLAATFVVPAAHVRAGEWDLDRAASFLTIPLVDMLLFGGFFGYAVVYRTKPEIHKRLIVLAFVAFILPGAGRLWFASSVPATIVAWFTPLLVAMGYDLVTRRRVHPVYWLGAAILGVSLLRLPLGESQIWLRVGRALLAPMI